MPNRQVYIAPPNLFTIALSRGTGTTFTNTGVAEFHSLFGSTGYVGPLPNVRPLPPHAFDTYRDKVNCREGYFRKYNDGRGTDSGVGSCLNRTPHSVVFYPAINYDNVYTRALDKLNDKLRGDLDLSVDIAEAHQVFKMLHVTDSAVNYTKTFFLKKLGPLHALANLRLEYIYGLKPLLSSIYGAADESVRVVLNKCERFKARGTDYGYKADQFELYCYWGLQRFSAQNVKMKVSTELGVDVRTDQFDLSRWGSLNPVSIAWELMPYSFVADWFLNVGGYLRNLETYLLNNNKFRSGYRTDFVAFEGTGVFEYPIPAGSTGNDTITATISGFRQTRSILNSYPLPLLPSFQANLGSSRLLNAAALLTQFLGRNFVIPKRKIFGQLKNAGRQRSRARADKYDYQLHDNINPFSSL